MRQSSTEVAMSSTKRITPVSHLTTRACTWGSTPDTPAHDPWQAKTSEHHHDHQDHPSSGMSHREIRVQYLEVLAFHNISHRWAVTYGPLWVPSLALLGGWHIIIRRPLLMSVPLNGCALSMLHCQGASATWPNCNWLQSALGRDPGLCISAFYPGSLSPLPAPILLIGDGLRLTSIKRGPRRGLDVKTQSSVECYCFGITVCAHKRIKVLCGRTQYNEQLRMLGKNSNRHMWCCCLNVFRWELGFDDHDKCSAELQMLMKYMSAFLCSQVCIWIIDFNRAKCTTAHLSHATFGLTADSKSISRH